MLYHTVKLSEECDIKYIARGPKAQVRYIFISSETKSRMIWMNIQREYENNFEAKVSRGG